MLTKVAYTTLFVGDQEKALDFYTNVLGFEQRVDNPAPDGSRFLMVGLAGQEFQIVLWPGTPGKARSAPGPSPAACIIETDDRRKEFERLKALETEFEEPEPVEALYAAHATLVDPAGNRITLRERRGQ